MTRMAFAPLLACAAAAAVAQPAEPRAPGRAAPEPQVQRLVLEDDSVRIEELRVRGQARSLVVQPKLPGVAAYEILPPEPGHETTTPARRGAGQRVWRVLSF
jgi:hypothetical protein